MRGPQILVEDDDGPVVECDAGSTVEGDSPRECDAGVITKCDASRDRDADPRPKILYRPRPKNLTSRIVLDQNLGGAHRTRPALRGHQSAAIGGEGPWHANPSTKTISLALLPLRFDLALFGSNGRRAWHSSRPMEAR